MQFFKHIFYIRKIVDYFNNIIQKEIINNNYGNKQ